MLSVSSWRMSLPPPAPSVERMAISVCRVAPRASSILETLAQAMRSTKPTTINRITSIVVTPPSARCMSGSIHTCTLALVSG
jgi:hypothetical protein